MWLNVLLPYIWIVVIGVGLFGLTVFVGLVEWLAESDLRCPVCRAAVRESFLICPVCTTKLKQACPSCKAPLEALWQVCPYCETQVAAPTPLDFSAPALQPPR